MICQLSVLSVRLLGFLSCGEMANRLEVIAYMVVGCVIAARLPVRRKIQRFRFYNAAFCAVVFYYFITF